MYELVEQEIKHLPENKNLPNHWRQIELVQVTKEFISGGTPSTQRPELWDGSIPWTTSAPISEKAVWLEIPQRFISEQGLQESASHLVPANSLLVATRVGVGKAVVTPFDIAISQDLTGVILNLEQAQPEYIAYQFKSERIQNILDGSKRGTTIKGISRFDLQQLKLYLPPLPEQRAIARILQTVQNAIQARRKELDLERERKAALMQHLFTHGTRGEATKQTEFGRIPESWKVDVLDRCAVIQTGIAKGRKIDKAHAVEVPYLRVANVQDGYLDLSEIKTIELLDVEIERYKLYPGDVVVTEGGDFDKLGRGFLWNGEIPECVHQNHIFAIRAKSEVLLPEYLAYLIQSNYGKAYFLSVAHKTTNLACINSTKLKAFPTLLPSLTEQQQIAAVLQACDSKIAALEKERALQEELFRALLEELMSGRLSALPLVEAEGGAQEALS
jgi:type I restriction enzyme S subunit